MRVHKWVVALMLLGGLGVPAAQAQTTGTVTGSLVTLVNSGQYSFNRLERLSAVANQATYNQLVGSCGGLQAPSAACAAATFGVYKISEELVQSANELLGAGPTQFSLHVDDQGLGFDLRWTAAEELSAPGSVSTEFVNTQIASVLSRITALRFGAAGGAIASTSYSGALGGSAGDDEDTDLPPSRLGVYFDSGFGYGKRHPTELEDAFDFDSKDFTLGMDYRLTPRFVFGGMLAHNDQRIDFNSNQSVVSGNMRMNGTGLTLYGLYEWQGPYLDFALGWQRMGIDSLRQIVYPSFNIDIEAVNAKATGSTNSTSILGSFDFGWPFNIRAAGIDPYVRLEYRHIDINGFSENSVYTGGSRIGTAAGYGFSYGDQSLKSTDGALGFKLRYTFTPKFGVIVPYLKAELDHNFDTDPFTVSATYAGLNAASSGAEFELPSDTRVKTYRIYAGGLSMVLPHGWQLFAQYQATSGISYLDHHIINGGIRGEF